MATVASPHLLIITFPAIGHIFPQLKLAHQLLTLGLRLTFLSTPKNLKYLKPLQDLHTPDKFQTLVLPFPDVPGIPPGAENLIDLPGLHFAPLLIEAYAKLCAPVGEWIKSHSDPPIAIMSDYFFSESTQKLASDLGIKRIGFSALNAHSVYRNWGERVDQESSLSRANMESWALIFNTFEGFDNEFVLFFKQKIEHGRVFVVGPLLSLEYGPLIQNEDEKDKVMEWLDDESMKHENDSVVYIGFGTQVNLNKTQVNAIAKALEASHCKFIWAIKVPLGMRNESYDENEINILTAIGVPERFRQDTAKRGIVTTKWVKQKEILKHRVVGAYLTHSGWNSVIEGLISGVVMLLWPMQADHHDNARRLSDDLKVALRVCEGLETIPDSIELAKALDNVTSEDGYADLRKGAIELGNKASGAIEEKIGSSSKSIAELVEQVKALGG